MSGGDELAYLSLIQVAERIRRRDVSAREVVDATLARIEAHDSRLHSFARVLRESAIAQAMAADAEIAQGLWRGPLHGVPIGIKDLLDMEGLPTGCGMPLRQDEPAGADATLITRLKRAGAVLIGKLHLTEGATLAHHPSLPRPVNPWGEAYWTGVSSSGSGVATAAGLCYGALGTDTGGSIRMPSFACGLTGVKPTWGRVSRHGLYPLAQSLDHVGPMTRSVADAAAILGVIAGEDPADPTTLPDPRPDYLSGLDAGGLSGLSIGVDRALVETRVDPLMVESLDAAVAVMEALGARVRPIEFPATAPLVAAIMPLMIAEVASAHAATFPAKAELYGPDLRGMIESAGAFTATDVARAVHGRAAFSGAVRKLFSDVDLLLTPGAPAPTPTWDELDALSGDMGGVLDRVGRFTLPFNATGSPTLSLPSGFAPSGLPLGIQLIGPHLSEALLCRAGHAFQMATDHHTRHPAL
jgi:amidase